MENVLRRGVTNGISKSLYTNHVVWYSSYHKRREDTNMKYVVEYVKPTDVMHGRRTEEFTGPAQVRAFLRRAREYSGSYTVLEVYKENSKGERVHFNG